MATNIELNEALVKKAMRLGKLKSKKDAVNLALDEFVQRREQMKVLSLFGTVEFDDDHDYKSQRSAR
jgi:Arc/MetJ family transcription regulator